LSRKSLRSGLYLVRAWSPLDGEVARARNSNSKGSVYGSKPLSPLTKSERQPGVEAPGAARHRRGREPRAGRDLAAGEVRVRHQRLDAGERLGRMRAPAPARAPREPHGRRGGQGVL
jgi:hypothetical protein